MRAELEFKSRGLMPEPRLLSAALIGEEMWGQHLQLRAMLWTLTPLLHAGLGRGLLANSSAHVPAASPAAPCQPSTKERRLARARWQCLLPSLPSRASFPPPSPYSPLLAPGSQGAHLAWVASWFVL